MKKKIVFFSGKRGGINHLIPIFEELKKTKLFTLKFIFTDMHVSKKFGNTIKEHKKIKKLIIINKSLINNDSIFSKSISVSLGMKKNTEIIKKEKPDIVIILGDRSELFSISVPCMLNNIPLIHLYGGDKTQGCTDENTRHAISMLSNYHIVSNEPSRRNLIKFGIDSSRIINSGLISLHSFNFSKIENKKKIFRKNKLDENKKLIISILHPETWNTNNLKKKIDVYFKILNKIEENLILIYPCSDPGYQYIMDGIEDLKNKKNIKIYKNLESIKFYNLLFYADLLIGNSSSGILEAGYFNTKVVNIGNRQKKRYFKNVFHLNFNKNKIQKRLNLIINKKKKHMNKFNKSHIYFKKDGLKRTVDFIKKIAIKKNHNQILKLY